MRVRGFFMVVYIEYALLENFLLDFVLLRLAFYASKVAVSGKRVCFSALLGAIFALLFPFLVLPIWLAVALKIAVGALFCLLAFGKIRNGKEWGRYALSTVFFFAFTFAFGGALTALLPSVPAKGLVGIGFALLTLLGVLFVRKLYEKRAVERFVYACTVKNGKKSARVSAFYDSGNTARYKNRPVCILSPDIAWELWGEEMFETTGQVRDEMQISTLNGTRKTRLYKGKLTVEKETTVDEVYFAVSANMLSRGYSLLLHSQIFEDGRKTDE